MSKVSVRRGTKRAPSPTPLPASKIPLPVVSTAAATPGGRNLSVKRLEALVRAGPKAPPPSLASTSSKTKVVKLPKYVGKAGDLAGSVEGESCDTSPWVDKYEPQTLDQHFVHKKKMEEFQSWLTNWEKQRICLLTGSAGSGKTATVFLVAKELGFEVKEWINPMSLTEYKPDSWKTGDDEVRGRSQLDLFSEFLLRSSQYSTLRIKGRAAPKESLILVEDFPNTLFRDPSILHQILRNYNVVGGRPLVFIMTDSSNSESSTFKLFPQDLFTELNAQHIPFNAVAPSYIFKFLSNILLQESVVVDRSLVDEIVTASGGDVRWALNNLQFRLQQPKATAAVASGFKRPKAKPNPFSKSKSQNMGEREESLFLFRALGKVLYCKRDLANFSEIENRLTGKLVAERRIHPLQEVPERIGDKVEVSPETFFNFLGQNYLSFFTSLDDVVKATGYISDAAHMFSCWNLNDMESSTRNYKNREAREEFGLSISIRGIMHSNNARVSSTWKPLRKSGLTALNARIQATVEGARCLFSGPITREFYPDNLPFYARLLPPHFRQDQIAFAKEVGIMNGSTFRAKKGRETLDDTFFDGVDESICLPLPLKVDKSCPAPPPVRLEIDQVEAVGDYAIEDYDSN